VTPPPLGSPIATGRTAEIYPWRDGMVLKLFRTWMPADAVHYELRIARAVCAAGVAAPQIGALVEVDGRLGLEYERLPEKSMGDALSAKPWRLIPLARQLAELHVAMHAVEAPPGLPAQRDRLGYKIRAAKGLPDALKDAALQMLAEAPEGHQLCHGDFHPWNVLMTAAGPRTIDWTDAMSGAPLADVARTTTVLEGVAHMDIPMTRWKKIALGWYARAYLAHYFTLRPGDKAEYRRWRLIAAAGRISEDIAGLNGWLREQVEVGLNIVNRET